MKARKKAKDKQRVSADVGMRGQLEIADADTPVDFDAITAVCVLPFTPSGQIVSIVQTRGVDIPGGHVQEHETSIDEVARREALEEAAICLSDLTRVGYLRSTVAGRSGSGTYIAVLAGFATEILPFGSHNDAQERRITSVPEFLATYSGGNASIMLTLVEGAVRLLLTRQEPGV